MLRDLRFAFRLLVKSPGFAAVAIGSLALGIALTTSLFTVVNALVLRPLPYDRPNELVDISQPRRVLPLDELRSARSFTGVAAYTPWNYPVVSAEGTKLVFSVRTSSSLFTVL